MTAWLVLCDILKLEAWLKKIQGINVILAIRT
jgi:hypothetical protein